MSPRVSFVRSKRALFCIIQTMLIQRQLKTCLTSMFIYICMYIYCICQNNWDFIENYAVVCVCVCVLCFSGVWRIGCLNKNGIKYTLMILGLAVHFCEVHVKEWQGNSFSETKTNGHATRLGATNNGCQPWEGWSNTHISASSNYILSSTEETWANCHLCWKCLFWGETCFETSPKTRPYPR